MGLFAQNHQDGLNSASQILETSTQSFNKSVGQSYLIEAKFDGAALQECCAKFDEIAQDGFPSNPGPFKRMAGFAVLLQHYPLFQFHSTTQDCQGSLLSDEEHLLWNPRLAVWSLPCIAEALSVNGDRHILEAFGLPSPHFQVEFIGFLRNFAFGSKGLGLPSNPILLERCVAVGLVLEASAYFSQTAVRSELQQKGAETCLNQIKEDQILLDDLIFNDLRILACSFDLGVE